MHSRVEHVEAREPDDKPLVNGNEEVPLLLRSLEAGNFRHWPVSHQSHVQLTKELARGNLHLR